MTPDSNEKKSYVEDESLAKNLRCEKCGVTLKNGEVTLNYMGNGFQVMLPKCPQCGIVFLSEELVTGKILRVEKSLEDK